MLKEGKAQIIEMLEEEFGKCNIGILTDYRGLTTAQITTLRRKLQEEGNQYKVVKNTLARFAASRAGMEDLAGAFEGPIAIAFGYGDITEPAKAIASYIRDSQAIIGIKGGFTADRVLTADEVTTLSTLPSREVLIARVLGQMKSPLTSLAGCLASPLRGIIGVLQAQIKQLEGE
ncbi:50S ribosomal protein L10 [Chloroflexota bacterium]